MADTATRAAAELPTRNPPWIADDFGVEQRPWAQTLRDDPCAYCGFHRRSSDQHAVTMTVDHIEPRRRDADRSASNMTAACEPCNALKADTSLLFFLLATNEARALSVAAAAQHGGRINRRFLSDADAEALSLALRGVTDDRR